LTRLYWITVAVLGAVLVHIVMVLFAPIEFFRVYSRLDSATRSANALVVLPPDTRRSMLPAFRGPGVAAYCKIDLSKGNVSITLLPPNTYWSLSVFSTTGRQLYALNDRQADTDQIAIDFKRAPSLIDKVLGAGSDDEAAVSLESAAWTVELPDVQAHAVLWIPYADPLLIKSGEEQMARSSCAAKKA
jgi:uncharacterized membrane protein